MGYRILHRKWNNRRAMWILMALELAGLIPILVLFGIAQPDLYRTKLWKVGFESKLNSNPAMTLYAYANHQPLPSIPLVWSQLLTNLNVAISIVSLFLLLLKLITFIMKVWFPLLACLANIGLVAVYTVSVYGQMGPDYADARYPSPVAWYIRKGCSIAQPFNLVKSCQLAQGTFAVTVYMLAVYTANLGLTIWALVPTEDDKIEDSDDEDDSPTDLKANRNWEMQSIKSPGLPQSMPFTPRTQAFHTLDRRLPLRQS